MIRYVQVFSFCWLVLPFRERNKLKTYNCIVFTYFNHTKLSPFLKSQPPSGFFLKDSQNFANFSLDILIKYILILKECTATMPEVQCFIN